MIMSRSKLQNNNAGRPNGPPLPHRCLVRVRTNPIVRGDPPMPMKFNADDPDEVNSAALAIMERFRELANERAAGYA